jgi:FkbM family methyltransferase
LSWSDLIDIHRELVKPYLNLSIGLDSHATDFIIRFPFSKFHFRPFLLSDIYISFGLWEPYVRKYLAILQPGDIFIDVGAHIGYYTILASRIVGKNGKIIAIEPDSRNLRLLKMNSINSGNIIIIEAGLGVGEFLYLDRKPNPLESSAKSIDVSGSCKVRCISLNDLAVYLDQSLLGQVYLKIDVEGNEMNIIKDSGKFIERFSPRIIMECENPGEVLAAIKGYDYVFSQLFGSYYLFERKI